MNMKIYLLIQSGLLFVCLAFYFTDPQFLSVGYTAFESYPVLSLIASYMIRGKIQGVRNKKSVIVASIPYLAWCAATVYIWMRS